MTSDPLDRKWADLELIYAAVIQDAKTSAYLSCGGTDGCAICTDAPTHSDPLTFQQRIERGHLDCAREMQRWAGAHGTVESMSSGSLKARLAEVLADPRLHLDWMTSEDVPW